MTKKLTINEIAELAKVSKGTVSKILNNREGVGESTRKRVLDIVQQFGFIPNPSAQALAFNKTSNIGLILPHRAGDNLLAPYWSYLLASIAQTAIEQSYNLMLLTPNEQGGLEDLYDRVVSSKKVDGLVIPAEFFRAQHQIRLEQSKIPFVLVGQSELDCNNYVDVDNYEAIHHLTLHIFKQGFKDIAYIGGPLNTLHTRSRVEAFKKTAAELGIRSIVASLDRYKPEAAHRAVDEILAQKSPPQALLMGAGGEILFDIISRLDSKKLIDQIKIYAFDDYPFLNFVSPKITAMRQPLKEIGREAVKMLIEIIEDFNYRPEPVILKSLLISR